MIAACVGKRAVRLASEVAACEMIASRLAEAGHGITTGNATGVDQICAWAASAVNPGLVELYLPWPSYERRAMSEGNKFWLADQATEHHVELAKNAHTGNWAYKKDSHKKLYIRNAMIVARFDHPVDIVYALPNYNQNGWGGTGHTLRIAANLGIPVWLLDKDRYWDPVEGQREQKA